MSDRWQAVSKRQGEGWAVSLRYGGFMVIQTWVEFNTRSVLVLAPGSDVRSVTIAADMQGVEVRCMIQGVYVGIPVLCSGWASYLKAEAQIPKQVFEDVVEQPLCLDYDKEVR